MQYVALMVKRQDGKSAPREYWQGLYENEGAYLVCKRDPSYNCLFPVLEMARQGLYHVEERSLSRLSEAAQLYIFC